MLTMIGAIATFEREMILERQAEGIALAKLKGKYKGRKATARSKSQEVIDMLGGAEQARNIPPVRDRYHQYLPDSQKQTKLKEYKMNHVSLITVLSLATAIISPQEQKIK